MTIVTSSSLPRHHRRRRRRRYHCRRRRHDHCRRRHDHHHRHHHGHRKKSANRAFASQVRSRSGQGRSGQASSGQLRSGLHASGKPVLGRRRKKYKMYRTATYMRQKFTNEATCEFHTTSSTSLPVPAIRMKFGFPSMSWTAVCEAKARTRSC